MPVVRRADFGDVPAGGTGYWAAICCVLPGIWVNAGDGQVVVFHVPDDCTYDYGFAGADASGFGELAGVCGGSLLFRNGSSGRWHSGVAYVELWSHGASAAGTR